MRKQDVIIFLWVLSILIPQPVKAASEAAVAQNQTREALQKQLDEKSAHIRELSLAFAEQQMKAAYLKRDRAMFEHDKEDTLLSDQDRQRLDEKIAAAEGHLAEIGKETATNREAYSAATQDYEGFLETHAAIFLTDENKKNG